jgi:hypothetical protein
VHWYVVQFFSFHRSIACFDSFYMLAGFDVLHRYVIFFMKSRIIVNSTVHRVHVLYVFLLRARF